MMKKISLFYYFFNSNKEVNNTKEAEKYYFNREITFENLERFFLRFRNLSSNKDGEKERLLSEEIKDVDLNYDQFKTNTIVQIPKVVGLNFKELVIDFEDNVLVLIVDSDQDNERLYNKWIFLFHSILKLANSNILRVYRFNAELNDLYLTKLPSQFPCIKLFLRHNKDNPIEYDQGPSLEVLSKFLNSMVPMLNLKVSMEQIQAYNREIFNNPYYIEEQIFFKLMMTEMNIF